MMKKKKKCLQHTHHPVVINIQPHPVGFERVNRRVLLLAIVVILLIIVGISVSAPEPLGTSPRSALSPALHEQWMERKNTSEKNATEVRIFAIFSTLCGKKFDLKK